MPYDLTQSADATLSQEMYDHSRRMTASVSGQPLAQPSHHLDRMDLHSQRERYYGRNTCPLIKWQLPRVRYKHRSLYILLYFRGVSQFFQVTIEACCEKYGSFLTGCPKRD